MKCLILAAGYATRMYPLTENFPKPLLDVKGKAIVDHLIDDVEATGNIDEYIVISNHKFIDKFNAWQQNSHLKDKIKVIDDGSTDNENRLGAVKDILFALDKCNIDDDIIVLAGDNLLDFSLKCFVDYFNNAKSSCVMRYYEESIERLKKTGVATVDENGVIVKMVEKPAVPESNWAIPPFYIYKKDDIAKIAEGIEQGCPTDAPGSFIAWLCTQTNVSAMEMPGKRYDIGSIQGYEKIKDNYNVVI
jgi:glucose-1-phosphate thymidylyltransferase